MVWYYLGSLIFLGLLMVNATLDSLAAPLAGQGGQATASNDNSTVLIVGGLVVILLVAGVGLILSRRKK
jgi:LPXTG-motif cell wall-anchored protein